MLLIIFLLLSSILHLLTSLYHITSYPHQLTPCYTHLANQGLLQGLGSATLAFIFFFYFYCRVQFLLLLKLVTVVLLIIFLLLSSILHLLTSLYHITSYPHQLTPCYTHLANQGLLQGLGSATLAFIFFFLKNSIILFYSCLRKSVQFLQGMPL